MSHNADHDGNTSVAPITADTDSTSTAANASRAYPGNTRAHSSRWRTVIANASRPPHHRPAATACTAMVATPAGVAAVCPTQARAASPSAASPAITAPVRLCANRSRHPTAAAAATRVARPVSVAVA